MTGMDGLKLLTLLFLWFPAGYCLVYSSLRRRSLSGTPGEINDSLAPIKGPVVALSAALTVVLWAAAQWAFGRGSVGAGWQILSFGSFASFHLIWWAMVVPRLRHDEGPGDACQPAQQVTPRRVASLTPRSSTDYLPAWWWAIPTAMVVAAPAYVAHAFATGQATHLLGRLWGIIGLLVALVFFVAYGWWACTARREPQLLPEKPTDELLSEYEAYRRLMARGVFWLMVGCMAVFLGAAVALVKASEASSGAVGGWIGGLGGTLVGLGGGAFGTLASLRRMRIARLGGGVATAPVASTTSLAMDRPRGLAGVFAPRFSGVYRPDSLDAAVLERLARRVRSGIFPYASPARNAYVVEDSSPGQLRFRSNSLAAGINLGLNDVRLELQDDAIRYEVGMRTWTGYVACLCGAIGVGLLAAYAARVVSLPETTVKLPDNPMTAHLWVVSSVVFWGGIWPWIMVAIHKRNAARVLCQLLDEANPASAPDGEPEVA